MHQTPVLPSAACWERTQGYVGSSSARRRTGLLCPDCQPERDAGFPKEVPSELLLVRAPLATWPHVLHQGQGDAGMQHAHSLFPTLQLKVLC